MYQTCSALASNLLSVDLQKEGVKQEPSLKCFKPLSVPLWTTEAPFRHMKTEIRDSIESFIFHGLNGFYWYFPFFSLYNNFWSQEQDDLGFFFWVITISVSVLHFIFLCEHLHKHLQDNFKVLSSKRQKEVSVVAKVINHLIINSESN